MPDAPPGAQPPQGISAKDQANHTLRHGGALFPDTLRWLWRDYGQA